MQGNNDLGLLEPRASGFCKYPGLLDKSVPMTEWGPRTAVSKEKREEDRCGRDEILDAADG